MKRGAFQRGLGAYWWLIMLFLYGPLCIVILFSFNEANTSAQFTEFSLRWYRALFQDQVIMGAIKNSLILAITSSVISTIMATFLGYGMYSHRYRRVAWLIWLIYLPIVMPDTVYGISQMSFFVNVHQILGILAPGLLTMIIAHISFQVPFVALVVYSRLVGLNTQLFDACHDLYANAVQRAWYFILPTLRPAILAGFFLAFTLSIDDFVISFFTSGPGSTTLPLYVWSAIQKGITPKVNVTASLMIYAVIVLGLIGAVIQYVKVKSGRNA